jgi:hypothetical protein
MWKEIDEFLDRFVDFMFGFVWVLIVLAWIFMWTT